MGSTLVWLQGQTCGGNTISLMNAHSPDFCGFLEAMAIEVIYHPSLSTAWGTELEQLLSDLAAERQPLDLFLFEGAIPTKGTGWYSTLGGRPIQSGIPLEAYDYVVNGKSAIEWIMERYQVTEDPRTGIVNDPNQWMAEQGNPRYLVDLIKRVVRVSMETLRIVKELPDLVVGE